MRSFLKLLFLVPFLVTAAPVQVKTFSSTSPTASTAATVPSGWVRVTCDTAAYVNFGKSDVAVTSSAYGDFLPALEGRWYYVSTSFQYFRHLAVAGTSVCQIAHDV